MLRYFVLTPFKKLAYKNIELNKVIEICPLFLKIILPEKFFQKFSFAKKNMHSQAEIKCFQKIKSVAL